MNTALSSPVGSRSPDRATDVEELLAALGDRVAPLTMARERTVPVPGELTDLFVEGGIVRGRVLSCAGDAATSMALSLVAPAVRAGSWLLVVDVPTLGLDAVVEAGLALERVVGVDTTGDPAVWADVVAAGADGFEVVITRVPDDVRASTVRKVTTRLQQRGVVVVVLGDTAGLRCDGVIDAVTRRWDGLGGGWGHLADRAVDVTASGRRMPGRRCRTVRFPMRTTDRPDVQRDPDVQLDDAPAPPPVDVPILSNAS